MYNSILLGAHAPSSMKVIEQERILVARRQLHGLGAYRAHPWGVAQLVARLLWEHILPIHEDKTSTPQPAGTLPEAGTISAKSLVKKRP